MYQADQRVLLVDIDPGRIHEMPMYHQFSELTNRQFSDRVHTFYRGVSSQTGDMHRGGEHQDRGATNGQPATRGERAQTSPRPAQGRSRPKERKDAPAARNARASIVKSDC